MPTKISKQKADLILKKYQKIYEVRQRYLEIVVRVNKKVGDYKLQKLAEKLQELIHES